VNSRNDTPVNIQRVHSTGNSIPQSDNCLKTATTPRRVRQDKGGQQVARSASPHPAPETKNTRAMAMNTKTTRTQKVFSEQPRIEKVTIWLSHRVKAELERRAEQEGLSLSATGAAFLEKAIQADLHTQHGALLGTLIAQAIHHNMRAYSNRLAALLIRVAFDAGQTRALVTNLLSRQPDVTPEILNILLDASSKTAKRNITQRTPQLEEIIKEVEAMFAEGGKAEAS
jgi:hypothetical protein